MKYSITVLIPGPNEPDPIEMQRFLQPLKDEIRLLENGITINTLRIRAKLAIVSCDLPATRKVLGFLSCNANQGKLGNHL